MSLSLSLNTASSDTASGDAAGHGSPADTTQRHTDAAEPAGPTGGCSGEP